MALEWELREQGPADAAHTVLLLPGGLCSAGSFAELMVEPALADAIGRGDASRPGRCATAGRLQRRELRPASSELASGWGRRRGRVQHGCGRCRRDGGLRRLQGAGRPARGQPVHEGRARVLPGARPSRRVLVACPPLCWPRAQPRWSSASRASPERQAEFGDFRRNVPRDAQQALHEYRVGCGAAMGAPTASARPRVPAWIVHAEKGDGGLTRRSGGRSRRAGTPDPRVTTPGPRGSLPAQPGPRPIAEGSAPLKPPAPR